MRVVRKLLVALALLLLAAGVVTAPTPAGAQEPTTGQNRPFFGPSTGVYESGGFLYFFGGVNRFPMDGINEALDPFDYDNLGDWFGFGGTGAFVAIQSWIVGVETYWLVRQEGDGNGTNSTSFWGNYTLLQAGYLFNLGRSHIYPSIGVGLSDFYLGLVEVPDPPFTGEPIPSQTYNVSAYVLQVSLGWHWLIEFPSSDPTRLRGIMLGWRLGYVFAPFGWDWRLRGAVVTDTPEMPLGYGLLSIQLGFGGFTIGHR